MKFVNILLSSFLFCTTMILPQAIQATEEIIHKEQNIDYQAPSPIQNKYKKNLLPSQYDSRKLGYVTSMENQGEFGTCWSYGVACAAETSLLKQGYIQDASQIDISELQVAYGYYHRKPDKLYHTSADDNIAGVSGENGYLQAGGNTYMNAMYLSQWQSVVDEKDFPNVNRYQDLLKDYDRYHQKEASYVLNEAIFLPNEKEAIKEAIIQYGSVVASYLSSTETNPYLYNTTKDATNHVITLVGYDDTIPKESFINSNDTHTLPSQDGAWIMKNSWGTGYGDEGYFYVSYDQYLGSVAAFRFQPYENENLYYYDGGTSVSARNHTNETSIQYANVFEAMNTDAFQQEYLSAVNVGIASTNTNYSIQIYRLNENSSSPQDGVALLQEPLQGSTTYAGLYTIELNQRIPLQMGDTFSIVVTLQSDQTLPQIYTSFSANIPNFINIMDTCEPNQSYYYDKDGWVDCYRISSDVARIKAISENEVKFDRSQVYQEYLNETLNNMKGLSDTEKQNYQQQILQANNDEYLKISNDFTKYQYEYDILSQMIQNDIQNKKTWVNSSDAQSLTNEQKTQFQQAWSTLEQLYKENASLDALKNQYETCIQLYQDFTLMTAQQLGGYAMLGKMLDNIDILQYGMDARYLSFSQRNDLYNMSATARNVYEQSNDENEYMQQAIILNQAYHQYQQIIDENKITSNYFMNQLQIWKNKEVDKELEDIYMNKMDKRDSLLQEVFPSEVYFDHYMQLAIFIRQIDLQNKVEVPEHKVPEKVENVTIQQDDYKTISLSWDMSEGALSYDIYRKGYQEDAIFELEANVSEPYYQDSGLMSGKLYTYYIIAKNKEGDSEASEQVSLATTLTGEVYLQMEQVSTSKFKLSWNKIDGATRYIVYRKRNDDKMKKVLTLGGDVFEYTTAEMPHGEYQFQVKAGRYDSIDRIMSDASNKVSGSVEALKPSVTVTAGSKSAKISWKKMEGVTHYQIYRATSSGGKYTKLATTKELNYTAKSLTKGKKYYFKVRGYKNYKSGTDIQYNVYTPYSSGKGIVVK